MMRAAGTGGGANIKWEDVMGDEPLKLDRIAEPMREAIRRYAGLLRELAGDNARSLTLFGAIAAGTFDASRHTVRNVLLLERVDLNMLRRLAEQGVKIGKDRIRAPLIMTDAYIGASLDTFPLEFIEIQQMHVTVFGGDPFGDLKFADEHVRLQCERESKSLLIGLRQGLLAAAGREKALEAVEQDVSDALLRTLRGMLWLKGQKEARGAADVVREVEKVTGREMPGVRAAVAGTGPRGWTSFERLFRDVASLAELADA